MKVSPKSDPEPCGVPDMFQNNSASHVRKKTRLFDDFCARTFKKTWGFGSPEPFQRAGKRAEWAFMNDQDPDNRIEAKRDGALARLRPAHGRLLRRGRGSVQRADGPARVSPDARPVRPR